ncbi:hypothetical protein QL285_024870 [Trifolium repens]|nr:hypothetical protein QL285_024870 [Trifolium repens]
MTLWSELKSLEEKKNRDLNLCAITLFRSSIFEFSSTRPCFGCENDPLVIFSRLSPNAKQIWVNKATEILERSKSQTWEYLAEEELLEDTNVELFKKHLSCAMTLHRNKTMAELLQKNIDVLRQNKTTAELLHQNIGAEKKHFFDVAWRLKLSEEDKKHFFDVAEEICNDVGTATELDWKNLLSYHHLTALDSE